MKPQVRLAHTGLLRATSTTGSVGEIRGKRRKRRKMVVVVVRVVGEINIDGEDCGEDFIFFILMLVKLISYDLVNVLVVV